MHLRCLTGRHAAAPGEVRNQGFSFSHCRRCRRDLIRSGSRWRLVPKGFRVVWRRAPGRSPEAAMRQLLLDLPATGRSLIEAPAPARRAPSDLLILGLLGLRYLMWTAGERVRTWRRREPARREAGQKVIYLAPWRPEATAQ